MENTDHDDYLKDKMEAESKKLPEHDKAEKMRMSGKGSHDPMYEDSCKNK